MHTPFFRALKGSAFLLLVLLAGCQKEESVTPNSQLTFRAPPVCNPANPTWTDNAPCAGDDLTVTFCVSATCGSLDMQYEITPGNWVPAGSGEQPTDGCISYTIPAAAAGAYNFRGQYNGNAGGCGQNVCNVGYNDFTYTANVVACGCPHEGNSFTGTAEAGSCDGTRGATYTLCSEDGLEYFKIQGGLTNFTGADAVIVVTGGTGVTSGQNTPGGSSNRIVTVEGGLDECSCVTVYVTWNSTNTGGTITGPWSAKDHVDLIPGTAYVAELSCIE